MRRVNLPTSLPPLTPVGYFLARRTPAYVRKLLIGTRLRRIKGKKRRLRYSIFKKIHVPGRVSLTWIIQYPELSVHWFKASDYQRSEIEQVRIDKSTDVTEVTMDIFHTHPDKDLIHTTIERREGKITHFGDPTLFVWPKAKLPTHIRFGINRTPFRVLRIWFFVRHNQNNTYRLWCRSTELGIHRNFEKLRALRDSFFENVKMEFEPTEKIQKNYGAMSNAEKQVAKHIMDLRKERDLNKKSEYWEYLEVGKLVAWTGYVVGEKAKRARRVHAKN